MSLPSVLLVWIALFFLHSSVWALDSFHESFLAKMRKNGSSKERIMAWRNRFVEMEAGIWVHSWAGWTNQYKPTILNPPVVFDLRELFPAIPLNFSEPISACRSYLRGLYAGDGKTLLNHADETAKEWLKDFLKVDETRTNKSYYVLPKLSRVTVLLTANMKIDGKKYAMVLWRAENGENPTNNSVALQTTSFVWENQAWLLTRVVRDTAFDSIITCGKASGAAVAKYEKFQAIMKQSSFPPHFWAIR